MRRIEQAAAQTNTDADHARHIERPWRSYTIKTITHPNFGPESAEAYAIDVGGQTS